jgi:uncharacterized protein (DUF302 family)
MSPSTDYGMRVTTKLSYEEAVKSTTAALAEQGFGVLTEIDVRATLKKKLDAEFRRYVILGACNPRLANRALNAELEVGLLLPCNVIVYEGDDGVVVSAIDPHAMLGFLRNDELHAVADEAATLLRAAVESLGR